MFSKAISGFALLSLQYLLKQPGFSFSWERRPEVPLKNPAEGVPEPPVLCPEMFLQVKLLVLQVKAPSAPAPAGNAAGGQQFLPQGKKNTEFCKLHRNPSS